MEDTRQKLSPSITEKLVMKTCLSKMDYQKKSIIQYPEYILRTPKIKLMTSALQKNFKSTQFLCEG